ncbi:MAG: alpha-amylase family glycosyl hydrolase [Candidatus Microsaccharimonas sp.]
MRRRSNKQLGSVVHANGVNFAVWAPFAKSVSLLQWLEFEWGETPMESDNHGYWSIEDVQVEPGQMYKYRITTTKGEVLDRNDPYARQVTDSDTGSSVIVASDFDWGDTEFVTIKKEAAVIYELHVGTFNKPDASTSGTFSTVAEKLEYLRDLGITHIELMPVTSMAMGHGWGYAPNYIFSIESAYGGRHGLLQLVKAAHELGIGIIVDVVYNHFFHESDLWQYDGWSENNRGGIYFFNDERGDTPWGGRPDYGRPEVRQFILDNITMWFAEYKVDGLRVDSTIYMRNSDGNNDKPDLDIPEAWSLMAEATNLAHKINPHAIMIAEDNATNDGIVKSATSGGMGFDAQWEVGFPHVIRDALGITHNKDQSALQGVEYELGHTYTGDAFDKVIFGDSHDTAANGASRLNESVTPGNAESLPARQRVLLASAVTLTAPGIPMLLQGQEFMQEGAFNEWKMLEWEKTEQFEGILLAHKHLIDLRRNRHGNTRGLLGQYTAVIHRDDEHMVIAYHRKDKGGPNDDTVVIVNFGGTLHKEYALTFPYEGHWRVRLNSSWKGYNVDFSEVPIEAALADKDGAAVISIAPYSTLILSIDEK